MGKKLFVGSTLVKIGPSCFSTFNSIYGVGKVRAQKLTAFYKYSRHKKIFGNRLKGRKVLRNPGRENFRDLVTQDLGRNIFNNSYFDIKIRNYVCRRILEKASIRCYKAYRLFQNLPTRGQRTRANAGTPSHFNPLLALKMKITTYPSLVQAYKQSELFLNGRFDELKRYKAAIEEKAKNKKAELKEKMNKKKQSFYKSQKNI